jgi:hypothetical protein
METLVMDAYDISNNMKQMWSDWTDKSSGTGKKIGDIKVCVWTEHGYREVTGLRYNPTMKFIELELDEE